MLNLSLNIIKKSRIYTISFLITNVYVGKKGSKISYFKLFGFKIKLNNIYIFNFKRIGWVVYSDKLEIYLDKILSTWVQIPYSLHKYNRR